MWFPDLIKEGEWHHLIVVLNRQVIKNSSFSLYVNGQHISTQRMLYISQNPGGGAANLALASSVYGFIGTPPMWRRSSRLSWKQGPCLLYEDLTSPQLAALLHQVRSLHNSILFSRLLNEKFSQSRIGVKKVRFFTNTHPRFASAVFDGVLGHPRLARIILPPEAS